MYEKGSGTSFTDAKLKPAIARRIEWLGCMNDRWMACLANNDRMGLLMLASEYEERNMRKTAKIIRLTVSNMKDISNA